MPRHAGTPIAVGVVGTVDECRRAGSTRTGQSRRCGRLGTGGLQPAPGCGRDRQDYEHPDRNKRPQCRMFRFTCPITPTTLGVIRWFPRRRNARRRSTSWIRPDCAHDRIRSRLRNMQAGALRRLLLGVGRVLAGARADLPRRRARLPTRLGGRAPLLGGVLDLVGSRGVPLGRGPEHEDASGSETACGSCRRLSTTRPARPRWPRSWTS